jgi:tripartite-type tricarboxylate transporter receptor subunit TctC
MRKVATAILACAGLAVSTLAAAQSFPKKNIEFIIPLSPGGGFDTYVRAVAPVMERHLPNSVRVVPTNVPAAGGARGAAQVYRARPDGHTIGIFNVPGMLVPQIRGDSGLQYDLKKLTWLGSFGRDTFGIAVAKDSPYKTIADLRSLNRPVKFTASGPSSTAHSATLIAADLLGIKHEIITGYKGSNDYVLAVIRGDGDAAISTLPVLEKFADSGELRIIGTFEETSSIPGAQSASEMGRPELSNIAVQRLIAGPPNLPQEVAKTLSDGLMAAMNDPALIAWSKQSGIDLEPGDAASAQKTLEEQFKFYERYSQYLGPAN